MEISSNDVGQLTKDGYGMSIVGHSIQPRTETEGLVRMEVDSQYKIILSNSNCHSSVVTIEIDGINIGNFLLYPYTEWELERPTDRPLSFLFSPPPKHSANVTATNGISSGRSNKGTSITRMALAGRKSCIVCIFHPEIGGRTLEMDVQAPHLKVSHRIEMPNDCTVQEFFVELSRDFGDWVLEPTCALVHWSTVEYDSPADDVLTSEMQVALWTCKRVCYPVRKMSLVNCRQVHLTATVSTTSEERRDIHVGLEEVATCGMVQDTLDKTSETPDQTWYFISHTGRYLGSTDWLPRHTYIYQLFHKDEILEELTTLRLHATCMRPRNHLQLYVRVVNSEVYTLEASHDTTIGELRYQLAQRGGPWGEDPCWMFGGTFLESGQPLSHYALKHKDVIDIFIRLNSRCQPKTIIRREPIAIDSESSSTDTACLIRKTEPPVSQDKRTKQSASSEEPRLQRGGTVLKGRVKQQFIEINPMELDIRFKTTLLLTLLPDGESEQEEQEQQEDTVQATSSSCEVM